jgi:hypothetical protein
MIAKIFTYRIFLLFVFLMLFGCSHASQSNDDFTAKYGNQVKKINLARNQEIKKDAKQQTKDSYKNVNQLSSRYSNQSLKNESPSSDIDNDFEIRYSGNYPGFRRIGAEFDEINIPQNDVYGVTTDFDKQKEYLLIGNNYLQKNIDDISSYSNFEEDVEISKILIAQKKQLQIKKSKVTKKPQVKQPINLTSDKPKQDKPEAKDKLDSDFNKIINLDNNIIK